MMDFSRNRARSIVDRKNKVTIDDFVDLSELEVLEIPERLANNAQLRDLADRIRVAAAEKKQVICMMGGHVVKVGASPYIIDLMKRGIVTHIAMNGGASIHDFEIAIFGGTSEYVDEAIRDGSFGMTEETGSVMSHAIRRHPQSYGLAIGKEIDKLQGAYRRFSLLYMAYALGVPATVHVAIGADVIHMHPHFDPAAAGQATHNDFRIFAESVSKLEEGVVLNIGSAVMMPEVFLKALSVARNQGYSVERFTAADLDMIDHYRPRVNVRQRPTSNGGVGIFVQGKHEETIPALYKMILEK